MLSACKQHVARRAPFCPCVQLPCCLPAPCPAELPDYVVVALPGLAQEVKHGAERVVLCDNARRVDAQADESHNIWVLRHVDERLHLLHDCLQHSGVAVLHDVIGNGRQPVKRVARGVHLLARHVDVVPAAAEHTALRATPNLFNHAQLVLADEVVEPGSRLQPL
eukprot:365679-Chlamydomonas_euryale.AAC.32